MGRLALAERNFRLVAAWTTATNRLAGGQSSPQDVASELKDQVAPGFSFSCHYAPSDTRLGSLFASGAGLADWVKSLEFRRQHAGILKQSGPSEIATTANVVYFSNTTTASLFDGPVVEWEEVTRMTVGGGLITEVSTFVDARPIEAAYGATAKAAD